MKRFRTQKSQKIRMPKPSISVPMKPSVKPRSPKIQASIRSRANTIMYHGPRFTSKSFTHWKNFVFWHEMIPNLQSFVVRNEAKTIPRSILKTFLRMLMYPGAKHKKNPFEIVGGINFPQRIIWENGGITEFGGLDDPDKILGGDFHMGWYNEVQRERNEASFSNLLGCLLEGRAGPLPSWVPWEYRLFLDCNPTSPGHFIYRRKEEGTIEWYDVLHEDNPLMSRWSGSKPSVFQGFNERGERNIRQLLEMYPPGYMRDRMVYGIPRGAEGMVYPMWDEDENVQVMRRSDYSKSCIWRWAIDIGGRDPHAIAIFVQTDGTPREHHLYKEVCKSSRDGTKISDAIKMAEKIHERENIPKPSAVFIDHNNKEFELQLLEKGYPVVLADKDILSGVEIMKEAIATRTFKVNKNSLEERDKTLGTALQGFKEEVGSYSHLPPEKRTGTIRDDLPDPSIRDKHFMDASRYYIKSLYLASEGYDINYSENYTNLHNLEDTDDISGIRLDNPSDIFAYLDSF